MIWSGIAPTDYHTWVLEVTPGVAGFMILAFTIKRFRFYAFAGALVAILLLSGYHDRRLLR